MRDFNTTRDVYIRPYYKAFQRHWLLKYIEIRMLQRKEFACAMPAKAVEDIALQNK